MLGRRTGAVLCVALLLAMGGAAHAQKTLTVPEQYPTIKAAVNNAADGDTIVVAPGTYSENVSAEMWPAVTIIGAGPGLTTVDGGGANSVFTIELATGSVALRGLTIRGGSASYHGYGPSGGGVYAGLVPGALTLTNCVVSGNWADGSGGGVYSASPATFTNCVFTGNTAGQTGGAAAGDWAPVTLTNCTVAGNTALGEGGGVRTSFGSATVTNCIMWGDTGGEFSLLASGLTVDHSDVQGGYAGTGNIDADPRLGPDLHLLLGSPCINTGDNAAVSGVPFDLDGNPRVIGPAVDMGAYESDLDTTPPVTTLTPSGTKTNGWYTPDVQVSFTVDDPDDAPDAITTHCEIDGTAYVGRGPFTVSGDGPHSVTYWSEDTAGNKEVARTEPFSTDATPPTLTWGTPTPGPGPGSWNNGQVSISFTVSDGGSGVASTSAASPLEFKQEGADQKQTVTVTDNAGNSATFTSPSVSIDVTPPAISVTAPTNTVYLLHQSVTASFTVADLLSGVAPGSIVATVPSGSAVDTATVGTKTFQVSATDVAGNAASQVVSYTVGYGVTALHDQNKSVKRGACFPIKVRLVDANGANVSGPGVTVHALGVALLSSDSGTLECEGSSNPDQDFRYDASLGGYIYNLSTSPLSSGKWVLTFTAGDDPTPHTVQFGVK